MELDLSNYYSQEANKEYMSVSQFKDFLKCERYALAKLNGEYEEEKSKAMLFGGYVDAYFSNRLDQFKEENPQIFKKDGTLLKDFEKANEVIKTIEDDPLLLERTKGKKQLILTGEINGVPFKGALDFIAERITDLKVVASINEKTWVNDNGKNVQKDFIDAYGYITQGAVYQELVKQFLGEIKPFDIMAISKEEEPDKALINIGQEFLDKALQEVKDLAPRYQAIKKGLIEPNGCGNCPVCRKFKKLTGVVSYKDFKGE